MAVADFPLDLLALSVASLCRTCDFIHVRLDNRQSVDPVWFQQYPKVTRVFRGSEDWNRSNWREDLARSLDDVRPDIVLTPDQDEVFEDSIDQELLEFWTSPKRIMLFKYLGPMPTCDGRLVLNGGTYPKTAHALGWKWQEGIGYHPYCGLAQPTQLAAPEGIPWQWHARTRVKHYCMWTTEMEAAKRVWVTKEYGPGEFS
jgi:hypothetical protein